MSRPDQHDFIMHVLNTDSPDDTPPEKRNYYETPFHCHPWFQHPSVPGLNMHYQFAVGPVTANWDKVENVPMTLQQNQRYHFKIYKHGQGFDLRLNGTLIKTFVNDRSQHCAKGIYIKENTYINQVWKENDAGCTQPAQDPPEDPAPEEPFPEEPAQHKPRKPHPPPKAHHGSYPEITADENSQCVAFFG
ncbi:unnamed protein product [Bursaphelenchus okinawaensis]|uniref:Galectin domain-containing protein n=1 Tax=Bursaphelenchus okinawaensis TaxID=465554 RepID=A0A811L6A8_9BILA|nr:unnamed protein product [Bursaphelenchus okinawaensis]CAG9117402.1 unnamed protein product [Bursaphelenchus okinawaensis]